MCNDAWGVGWNWWRSFRLKLSVFIPFFVFYWEYYSLPMSEAKKKGRAKLGMWSMVALFLVCAFWGLSITFSSYM